MIENPPSQFFKNLSAFFLTTSLAAAYFLGGYFGLLLAVPPSNASPVWPASGIALAAILLFDKRAVPGIFVGALLAQFYSYGDTSSAEKLMSTAVTGIIAGIGSCTQAMFGAFLINRYVGHRDPLLDDDKILRFLLLAGPVSCIIAPSIGITTLFLQGVITGADFPLSWAIWWIGDAIGVLIFTPLVLIVLAQPESPWRMRRRSVALPLIVLSALVVVLFQYGQRLESARIRAVFDKQADFIHDTLNDEFQQHIEIVQTLQGFFSSSSTISAQQFAIFTQPMATRHHSIQALEWIARVSLQGRAVYEREFQVIRETDQKGDMVPALQRSEYYPITYLQPHAGNERAMEFDVSTNPRAWKAIVHARDSGTISATGKIQLIQDRQKHSGIVLYGPVYFRYPDATPLQDKRKNLQGLAAVVIRIDDVVAAALQQLKNNQLLIKITDQEERLFSNFPDNDIIPGHSIALKKTARIKFADRIWTASYIPSPDFIHRQTSWHAWWLLSAGFLFTGLTGMGLLMLTGRTLRTERIVKTRTRELEREIAEHNRVNFEHERHNLVLQAVAGNASLSEILDLIVRSAEQMIPDSICSIQLVDRERKKLRHGAAPNLPDFYNAAVDGLSFGKGIGSCGNTAYTGQRTIASDISRHPNWSKYTDIAEKAGLAACWSEPVLSSDQQVLGTFAIYYRTPREPDAFALQKMQELAQLASIAIERKNSEQQIQHLAFYDALTDLPNRRLLLDRLDKELQIITRHHSFGALLFLDLDHFKTLNDSLGHQIGDELLKQVAARLKQCIRSEDTVARLGGDEFIVLLRSTDMAEEEMTSHALHTAERMQSELQAPYILTGYEHHITPSIGITLFSRQNAIAEEILKQADTAMYNAKAAGRNTISFYHHAMQKQANQRLELEKNLRIALEKQQFSLHYQPQYDDQGKFIGAEALLRWQHPEKGMISPVDFIPVAEDTGLILQLGEWVLDTACRQLQASPKLSKLSVNISPRQFRQAKFVDQIQATLQKHQVIPRRLMIEVTEGSVIDDIEDSVWKLQTLQHLGIDIAIDDFGTGYSSLTYLKTLPLNQLKIDRSFIRDIPDDCNDAVIVETIIVMAHHLGLNVIAEGVETLEQLQFLQSRGCHCYQGYYFSRPLCVEDFDKLEFDTD